MKSNQSFASLEATNLVPSKGNTAELRSAAAFSDGVVVDFDAGIIKNAAIMTIGPTLGHGFSVDKLSIEQLSGLINAANGVKARFKHPQPIKTQDGKLILPDDLGSDVGYVRNARVVGDAVRGDVHLAEHSKDLPGFGNVWNYLLLKAKNDPGSFGLSAVIHFDAELVADASGQPIDLVARINAVDAVDFVGKPAANPAGLLAAANPADANPDEPSLCTMSYRINGREASFSAAPQSKKSSNSNGGKKQNKPIPPQACCLRPHFIKNRPRVRPYHKEILWTRK